MLVRDILQSKGDRVLTTSPQASLANVVDVMIANNCGSLVVCEGERMVGIITERDLLRAVSSRIPLDEIRVETKMSTAVVTASPDDTVADLMGRMTQYRIRHVPVLRNEQLVGLISIGDAVKAQHDQLRLENHYLLSYIQS